MGNLLSLCMKSDIATNLDTKIVNKIDDKLDNKLNDKIEDKIVTDYLNNLWSSESENPRVLNNLVDKIEDKTVNEINQEEFKKFKDLIKDKFTSINMIGNFNYNNKLEKEVRLKKNELSESDILTSYKAYNDLTNFNKINNDTMNKINTVQVALKIKDKTKDHMDINNYRFIQLHSKSIKLIDRLWCFKVMNLIKSLDTHIFKSNLVRDIDGMTCMPIIETANKNTLSRTNVVLIDITKAFDSCEFDVIETLLYKSLSRKMDKNIARVLTDQYIFITKQREIYYGKYKINYKKGLPTGLPSSNIIFNLLMDEIIYEWLNEHSISFKIDKDFLLNIYVDDIYLKLINLDIKIPIIDTLINKIKKYKFSVNYEKCKADANLKLIEFFEKFQILEETDMYLGIPFTRDFKIYTELVLDKFNKNNHTNYTYNNLYKKLIDKDVDAKNIYGYFNYKLKPLLNDYNEEKLITFMEKKLISQVCSLCKN